RQTILDEAQHVAAAAGERDRLVCVARTLRDGDGVAKLLREGVGKRPHATPPFPAPEDRETAPTILSRVIGRSLIRRPMALNTALATAAGAGTLLDSPMLFAPNGPSPSSDSMKMTSIGGASRWVRSLAP